MSIDAHKIDGQVLKGYPEMVHGLTDDKAEFRRDVLKVLNLSTDTINGLSCFIRVNLQSRRFGFFFEKPLYPRIKIIEPLLRPTNPTQCIFQRVKSGIHDRHSFSLSLNRNNAPMSVG